MSKPMVKPGTEEYDVHIKEEIEHYTKIYAEHQAEGADSERALCEPAPATWDEMNRRAADLVRARTGRTMFEHLETRLRSPRNRMLSLGSGPGGVELTVATAAPSASIQCIDLNPNLLALGRERATRQGLNVWFEQGDLNTLTLPLRMYDLVFCHASLHHVIELEHLIDQIKSTLRPGGELIIVDVVTPNGYLMWSETRAIVRAIFRTLPERFRINHTAYDKPSIDEMIWEMDTSQSGMECVRSDDILPVLDAAFLTRAYVPYFCICRRFFDTMYGPNYDMSCPLDRAILDWIWQLDLHYLDSGRLQPETFFGIYTAE